jgi:hypothetical protein
MSLRDVILTLQYCLETFEATCQCGRCDPCTKGQDDIRNTIAHLDSDSLRALCQDAELAKLTVEDNTNLRKNRITLIPGQPVLARFSGPHADEIKALFETDTIATPFDSRHPRPDVLSAVQRQNPTATVEWESARTESGS